MRDVPEWLQPFEEGFTERALSSTEDVSHAVVVSTPPPAIPASTLPPSTQLSNKSGGGHHVSAHSPKNLNCEVCQCTRITNTPRERNREHRAARRVKKEHAHHWRSLDCMKAGGKKKADELPNGQTLQRGDLTHHLTDRPYRLVRTSSIAFVFER